MQECRSRYTTNPNMAPERNKRSSVVPLAVGALIVIDAALVFAPAAAKMPLGIGFAVVLVACGVSMIQKEAARCDAAEAEMDRISVSQRTILDSTSFAVISVDGTGRVNLMNKAAEAMLGYPAFE